MNVLSHTLVSAIRIYRWTISPAQRFLFGPGSGCRFTPSCSAYAQDAIMVHGAGAGSWLAMRRVCRCHPWGGHGYDAVPPRVKMTAEVDLSFRPVFRETLKDFHG